MGEDLKLRAKERLATAEAARPRAGDVWEPEDHQAGRHKKGVLREYFESAVVTLIMALFGMSFVIQAVKVPTGSMKNTIYIEDHLLVNKFIYGASPPLLPARAIRRGDVVVFKYPETPEVNYVKRVIGLPGETLELNAATHRIYVNGAELPERRVYVEPQPDPRDPAPLTADYEESAAPRANWTVYYYQDRNASGEDFRYGVRQPYKVPVKGDPIPDEVRGSPQLRRVYDADKDGRYDSDQYFCMGDNRDNSQDSRYWGTVPRSLIVGRAMLVYWSVDRGDSESNFLTDFFTRTRWGRTGQFIK